MTHLIKSITLLAVLAIASSPVLADGHKEMQEAKEKVMEKSSKSKYDLRELRQDVDEDKVREKIDDADYKANMEKLHDKVKKPLQDSEEQKVESAPE